jgi:signal peptidase I
MFTPKWKDEAKHLAKGARKFVHYKRDLLKPDRVDEIESRRTDLLAAVKSGDRAKVDEASKQLRAVCENALPYEKPLGWFEENVEVMFVAIVIALGLRAYYLQPFRIPTGSMQPTLNGIIGTPLPQAKWPALPVRLWEKAMRGRSYVRVEAERDLRLPVVRTPNPDIPVMTQLADKQMLHFFSRSILTAADGRTLRMPAPANPVYYAGFAETLQNAANRGGIGLNGMVDLPKGTVLCEGTIDTGDLVLVDKFSYHFRKPKRGEVFVFDTIGNRGIHERSGDQAAGSHYIKRLCGVPGDTLSIDSPNLLVDGRIAKEPGIQRVIEGKGGYAINPQGYGLAGGEGSSRSLSQYLARPDDRLALKEKARPGMREYAALGDNTGNSLDSRYWGPVKEFNLVGPALFSLWPITTGHWGIIR